MDISSAAGTKEHCKLIIITVVATTIFKCKVNLGKLK